MCTNAQCTQRNIFLFLKCLQKNHKNAHKITFNIRDCVLCADRGHGANCGWTVQSCRRFKKVIRRLFDTGSDLWLTTSETVFLPLFCYSYHCVPEPETSERSLQTFFHYCILSNYDWSPQPPHIIFLKDMDLQLSLNRTVLLSQTLTWVLLGKIMLTWWNMHLFLVEEEADNILVCRQNWHIDMQTKPIYSSK